VSGHVGEGARVQQEPSTRLDDLSDVIETRGVAHGVTAARRIEDDVPTTNLL
jgi:hypothetical protein